LNASILETQSDLNETTMLINEQVITTEYCPAIFNVIRKMDDITDN
jgi:hypothetical protein